MRAAAAHARRGRRFSTAVMLAITLAGVAGAALLAQGGGPQPTAFARAPSGQYAVVAKHLGGASTIAVVGAEVGGAPMEIATIPHLDGFSLRGTVSPDGRSVALIAPDGGLPTQPLASLITLNLETGEARWLAEGLDPLQDALWTPDSRAVLVTRTVRSADGSLGVEVARVGLDGEATVIESHAGALTVAPVGFDAEGRLLAVRLDARGSTLTRAGTAIRWLSTYFTRDWALSPDGAQLAFVEINLTDGLRYLPRVVRLAGGGAVWAAADANGQALGAAWAPAGESPAFGREPSPPPPGSVSAQGAGGFDVPLGYSRDGNSLAVHHWSGASFGEPGTPQLAIVNGAGRRPLEGFTRFFGWSAR